MPSARSYVIRASFLSPTTSPSPSGPRRRPAPAPLEAARRFQIWGTCLFSDHADQAKCPSATVAAGKTKSPGKKRPRACVGVGERKELFSSAEDLGCGYFGPRGCIPGRRENGRPSFARSREEYTHTHTPAPLGFANPENKPRLVSRTGRTCAVLTGRRRDERKLLGATAARQQR